MAMPPFEAHYVLHENMAVFQGSKPNFIRAFYPFWGSGTGIVLFTGIFYTAARLLYDQLLNGIYCTVRDRACFSRRLCGQQIPLWGGMVWALWGGAEQLTARLVHASTAADTAKFHQFDNLTNNWIMSVDSRNLPSAELTNTLYTVVKYTYFTVMNFLRSRKTIGIIA